MLVECRASGFAGLFDCAKMWHGIHVLGIRSYTGARALLGTGFHAGTAAFDKARMEGAPITIDDAAGAVVDAIAERADECQWRSDDLTRRQVEAKALALHTVYCKDVSPQFEFHAVELTLEPLDVDCGDGVIIRLKGTLDRTRIRRDPAFFDQLGVNDLKSGTRAILPDGRVAIAKHKPQVGIYELTAEHTMKVPITAPAEIIAADTSSARPRFAIGTANNSRELLLGDGEDPGYLRQAAIMFKHDLFPANPRSPLCSERFCPLWSRCKHHD